MGKASAHASRRVALVVALSLAVVSGPGYTSLAASGEAVSQITPEDLQDALDRGDLSPEEFSLLTVMVQARLRSDSLELARLAQRLSLAAGPQPAAGRKTRGELRYSAYAPLRGSGSSGQYLEFEPQLGGVSARFHSRRVNAQTWQVTAASIRAAAGPLEIECGSLDLIWTGGLVVGRYPAFVKPAGQNVAGLWQPANSRLQGGRVLSRGGHIEVEVMASSVSDSVWRHNVTGARIRGSLAGFWFEPAVVGQKLALRTRSSDYTSLVCGWSFGSSSRRASFQANTALTGGSVALQVRADGRSTPARWECEYWAVPAGFRHPLLHGRGEYDREPVYYPELGMQLQSASTGESGGRLAVRSGGSQTYGRITATVWREQPYRAASVQVGADAQTGGRVHKLRMEYTHLVRSVYLSGSVRHEVGLFTQYRSVFAEARGRILRGEGLPSGTVGGRLGGGVRVHTAGAGQWEVRATWESYDLSLASRQFVTLRVDQRLPFHHGELALHVRWRSAYASQPAVLSLRVDSSVYL